MAVTYESFVKQLRERHDLGDNLTDENVFNYGKAKYPNVNVDTSTRPTVVDTDDSPSTLAHLMRFGIDDDSWEWAKHGYANSLQGTTEKYMTGKLPFELDSEWDDLPWWQQSLGMIASFGMPLDMVTLAGGGGLARLGVQGVKKAGTKALAQRGVTELAEKGIKRRITDLGQKYGIKGAGQ